MNQKIITTKPLNQNKMDFALGYLAGMIVMFAIGMSLKAQWERDLEKLKDFEYWKEWKNKSE